MTASCAPQSLPRENVTIHPRAAILCDLERESEMRGCSAGILNSRPHVIDRQWLCHPFISGEELSKAMRGSWSERFASLEELSNTMGSEPHTPRAIVS